MSPADVKYWLGQGKSAVPLPRPGVIAHENALQQLRAAASCRSTPYVLTDAHGRDEDVPHIELIDRAIANLLEARKALDLHRPNFPKADAYIEEAGFVLRKLEETGAAARFGSDV